MNKIILISGKAQHGKDTVAEQLHKALDANGYNSATFHIADYLKFIATKYYGWNGEKDVQGRTLLQTLASTARQLDEDFWVCIASDALKLLSCEYDYIVVPDVRYKNEIEVLCRDHECTRIRIERPEFDIGLTEEQKAHISETDLDDYAEWDHRVINNSSIDKLYSAAVNLIL